MYDVKSMKAEEFINHDEIMDTLKWAEENKSNQALIKSVLLKATEMKGLDHREAALLLVADENLDDVFGLARRIKEKFYGNRIVLFAPLYLSNYCINSCSYCPYHVQNKNIDRKKLTQDDIRNEVTALQDMGHKRLALELGEDPVNNPIEYMLESIETVYSVKHWNGAIRRVNVNIAATSADDYKKLKDAGIGTYILFQETYKRDSYEKLHPAGPKSNYSRQTEAMDSAMEGGLDDVGIGVLFGLEDYRYEYVALLMHAEHLEAAHGVGPHTVSFPRIRAADDIDPGKFPHAVCDDVFEKLVACVRISAPYTGIIVSTRESRECRERALSVGVSQISGGSRTSVGGYLLPSKLAQTENTKQFDITDNRPLEEVVAWLMECGHIPSFCTACYREGRTGDRFMELCKSGEIHNCCHPNALMTLEEYLQDYAGEDTKEIGEKLIKAELLNIPNKKVRDLITEHIKEIKNGSRDFRV